MYGDIEAGYPYIRMIVSRVVTCKENAPNETQDINCTNGTNETNETNHPKVPRSSGPNFDPGSGGDWSHFGFWPVCVKMPQSYGSLAIPLHRVHTHIPGGEIGFLIPDFDRVS